jgi:hypothetical protein
MAMRFDGVAVPEIEYALGIDYEHEHRDAEHEHEEKSRIKAMQTKASVSRCRLASGQHLGLADRRCSGMQTD